MIPRFTPIRNKHTILFSNLQTSGNKEQQAEIRGRSEKFSA